MTIETLCAAKSKSVTENIIEPNSSFLKYISAVQDTHPTSGIPPKMADIKQSKAQCITWLTMRSKPNCFEICLLFFIIVIDVVIVVVLDDVVIDVAVKDSLR